MSPVLRARIAGAIYLIVFTAGTIALVTASQLANIIAGICYIAVTILFYFIFKPVSKGLSLIAALTSLAGISIGILSALGFVPVQLHPLVFFGVYCLLIGYLVFKSGFLPRFLGVLMSIGGLGWLTFISPQLADSLSPYNFAPGMIGEGLLTLWLLIMGVKVPAKN
jgi:hypothetical protein